MFDGVEQGVRKPPTQPPPNVTEDDWARLWKRKRRSRASLNFRDKRCATPRPLLFVVCAASLSSRSANSLKETRTDYKRVRASRKTSSAARLGNAPASTASDRRCASSAQSRAFSSAESCSKLSRRRSANRARSFGSSFRAAASSSSMLIREILRPDCAGCLDGPTISSQRRYRCSRLLISSGQGFAFIWVAMLAAARISRLTDLQVRNP